MSQNPVVNPNLALSRDLDVEIQLSRPQTEIATDMTLLCFLTPDLPFAPDNSRVRYYSSFEALSADAAPGSPLYWAGNAFFSRSLRPSTLAVGRVFEEAVPAGLIAGDFDLAALRAVSDGAFRLELNGAPVQFSGLDLSGAADLDALCALLAEKCAEAAPDLKVSLRYNALTLETVQTGEGAALSFAQPPLFAAPGASGASEGTDESGDNGENSDQNGALPAAPASYTDISGLLGLTAAAGARLWQGYDPAGLTAEAALVRQASISNGRPIYGWTLDARWRDTQAQKDFADWIEPLAPAIFCGCTNSASAWTAGSSANFGVYIQNKGYTRSAAFWHDNEQVYPDVSYLALALSVNYSLPDSAITMKFKELDGIEPASLTETMLSTLVSRNINCYTRIGNNARTVREGAQAAPTWFTDTRVNLDNFREELQVEVYNAFLRRPKIPYTAAGQDVLVSAAARICRKYERNGVFAPRDVEAPELESGFTTLPAFDIKPVPVAFSTASERAARQAPPIQITAYEAGAFHKISIKVDVYN